MAKKTSGTKKAAITRRSLVLTALALGAQSRSGAAQLFEPAGVPVSNLLPEPDWSSLERGPQVEISDVVDGDTVELVRGPDVRMVGTQAPKLPLGRAHVEEWPLARQAKAELVQLVARHGRQAQLYFGGRKTDRHNRHLAHIVLADGSGSPVWLQGAMVLAGLARVYTFADNRSLIPDLLLRERVARAARRSMWGHDEYQLRDARDPADLLQRVNNFELVEGVVRNVAAQRALWYLNFGETWREDFTITIDRDHDDVFENSQVNLSSLEGVPVRVRGWVMDHGGPLIRVDHPEAIELLSEQSR
ncbi:MAG: thermonuclease family protein [Devosiaceae bacterium]